MKISRKTKGLGLLVGGLLMIAGGISGGKHCLNEESKILNQYPEIKRVQEIRGEIRESIFVTNDFEGLLSNVYKNPENTQKYKNLINEYNELNTPELNAQEIKSINYNQGQAGGFLIAPMTGLMGLMFSTLYLVKRKENHK